MQALEQFEELVERLLEGSFARLFRSPVHPVELARKMERSMEAGKRMGVYGLVAPNQYQVYVNDGDYVELSPFVRGMEQELSDLIRTLGERRAYSFTGPMMVSVIPDESLGKHQARVESTIADASTVARQAPAAPDAQATIALPVHRGKTIRKSLGWLVKRDDSGVERFYPLDRKLITVGRSLDNNVVLEDSKVSRHHAQIRVVGEQLVIMDLDSTNGTFVNRKKTKELVITYGDEISFGGVNLILTASRPQ